VLEEFANLVSFHHFIGSTFLMANSEADVEARQTIDRVLSILVR
jgi:hypothetical protein